jgi:hypothetical protein
LPNLDGKRFFASLRFAEGLAAFWSLFCRFAHNGVVNPGFAGFHAQPMACWRSAQTRGERRAAKPVGLLLFSLLLSGCLLLSAAAQDRENGLVRLPEAAEQPVSADRPEEFFSPGADAAYEISRGRKMDRGRYVFPGTLFEAGTGHRPRPRVSPMIVVESSQNDWAVDRLP